MKLLKYKEFEVLTEQSAVKKITPEKFIKAAEKGDFLVVKLYVEQGGNIEVNYSISRWNALISASVKGKLEIVKYLVENKADIEAVETNGRTSFNLASMHNQVEILKYLVSKNVNIHTKDNDGNTALINACFKDSLEAVVYLIQLGVDIEERDNDGWTALRLAQYYNHKEIEEILKDPKGYLMRKKLEPNMNKVQKNSGIF